VDLKLDEQGISAIHMSRVVPMCHSMSGKDSHM